MHMLCLQNDYEESLEEDNFELTAEEKLEREFDRVHLKVETTARGDDENYPVR